MKVPTILTAEGRRGYAFAALVGGAMVMTVFAAVGVWLARHSAGLSFWLALAAHAQIMLCLAALGGLLVKRTFSATREGLTYSDQGEVQGARRVEKAATEERREIEHEAEAPDELPPRPGDSE